MKLRDRFVAVGVLAIVAGAPFLLTMCSPAKPQSSPSASTATTDTDASPSTPPTSAEAPATASASASVASSSPPANVTPPAPEPPEPPPYKGPLPGNCKAIERALGTARTLTCKVAADCTNYGGYCMCPYPVSRAALPKLQALGEAFTKKDCHHSGPPRPCPTCSPAPEPRCVAGKCS